MRILHYMPGIPPVRDGGMIRYASDLMRQELLMGEDVQMLVPGVIPKNTARKIKIYACGTYMRIPAYAIYNPLPVPMNNGIMDIDMYTRNCDGKVYARFLQKIRPDLIHIHTLMGMHQEFLSEAWHLKIPVLFTSHDYFGLCPAVNLWFADHICEDIYWKKCELCCKNAYSVRRLRIEQSRAYRCYRKSRCLTRLVHTDIGGHWFQGMRAPAIADVCKEEVREKEVLKDYSGLRDYYKGMFSKISFFHFNSTISQAIYSFRLGEVKGTVVSISHSGIFDRRKKRSFVKKMRLGYFGGWDMHKGFFLLLQVCGELYEEGCRDMELHVYSDTEKRKEPFIINHKKFHAGQLSETLENIDLLAVPSVCAETFGFVVLEALSCGVPVVVSDYVGAKDLLRAHPGCGVSFDGTADGLKEILTDLYEHRQKLKDMNENIRGMKYEFAYEAHVKKILDLYQNLRSSSDNP